MCIDANRFLPSDVLASLTKGQATETLPAAREVFRQLEQNASLAAETGLPLCQDCGLGVFFVEVGEAVRVADGSLREAINAGMDNALAEQIYELDRCIECGCCVAACGTALMREDFLGAVALNRIARFILDPRDERTEKEYFDIVGTDEGIFGCMGLLGCEDVCPKEIPLQEQLGKLRRKMALAAVKNLLPKFLKKDF